MSISPKIGPCIDCGGDAKKYIMAGRCVQGPHFHYQKHRAGISAERKKKKNKEKTLRTVAKGGMTLGKWFNDQISMMPRECENCSAYLSPYNVIGQRSYIAHIVPKRYFESVMVHPSNRLFLCVDCHANFDNWLNKEVMQMRCWPIAASRFEKFKDLIEPHEYKHLRDGFKMLI
jgi:hypothetical protein